MPDPTLRILPSATVEALPHPASFALPDARYRGTHATVSLDELTPADVPVLRQIYAMLLDVHEQLGAALQEGQGPDELVARAKRLGDSEAYREARAGAIQLGTSLQRGPHEFRLRQAYHDLRGGSLAGLILYFDLLRAGRVDARAVDRLFLLSRDHLKMMRNAVYDLDPERYAADLVTKRHGVGLLRDKWHDTRYDQPGHTVQVRMYSSFDGDIAERCMEFAALDRALYNLVNNATRFAFDERVDLYLQPVTVADRTHVRLTVANRVQGSHAKALRKAHGDDLGPLFLGGFTTGGHGLGMRIAAEFVTHGYGLPKVRQAVDEHYVGARLVDKVFTAWVHWPAA